MKQQPGVTARARRAQLALALIGTVGLLPQACGREDDGMALAPLPDPTLRVTVATTGVDVDGDGYLLHGDNIEQAVVTPGGTVTIYRDLAPGTYELRLDHLAANCHLDGPAAVPVTIVEGQLTSVAFLVQCTATTGVFRLLAPTSGRDYHTASYRVQLTSGELLSLTASLRPNQSTIVEQLPAGTYQLTFESRAENCATTGDNPRTAAITVGEPQYQTTEVVFEVECAATTGDVRLRAPTTGDDFDPDGYTVWRDGSQVIACDPFEYPGCYSPAPLRIYPDGGWLLPEVPPGTYVYELRDVASNCEVAGIHPRPVTVSVGERAEVVFSVVCTSLP